MNVPYHPPGSANVNDVEIVYDSFGSPGAKPMVLIAGLGDQMISWPRPFCERLAARGYWVIRFDNRDAGLSTRFHDQPLPTLTSLAWNYLRGNPQPAPYTLGDMAKDVVGLLAYLGLESAHIIGGSLGGMIAEMCAIQHAQHVRTLTVVMSPASNQRFRLPKPKTIILFKSPPGDRDGFIEHFVKVKRAARGGGFEFDEAYVRERAGQMYDRSPELPGTNRQLAALLASLRTLNQSLSTIHVPTLVIHGSNDPLVPVQHGYHAARVIPKAKRVIIDGLGHEFPAPAWPRVIEAITLHAV
jgi:pimeloyl-ACP methyl ester carboxylesterase